MKYNAIYKPNQLICGTGQVAIVTGWTVKNAIAKHLSPEDYAVIGNLYSPTRGINFLVRNLLANPQVRYLIILEATKEDKNAGGCLCLFDFFRHGVRHGASDTGRECWVINSTVTGYIDSEIPLEFLEDLRRGMCCQMVTSSKELVDLAKQINYCNPPLGLRGDPLIFPEREITATVLPGPRYGHRIEGKTIAETWVKILHRIKTTGTVRPTGYDGQWQELIDLMAIVADEPPEFYFPDPNYLPIKREYLDGYIPQILEDAPYLEGVKYTYGQRLRSWFGKDQIEQVINKLIKEIDAASAVMNLWDSGSGSPPFDMAQSHLDGAKIARFGRKEGDSDHEHGGSPCLNHIWVRVVNGELSLTAVFRSNDMFSAWPANAMGLRALQQHIRDEISDRSEYVLSMGPLITISQSAHIYDDTWENVDQLIKSQYERICQQEQRDYADPSGSFLIELEDGQIIVKHITPGSGEMVGVYAGKNPLKLVRELCRDNPAIQPEHIGYLGIELQKASECLNGDFEYNQDKNN